MRIPIIYVDDEPMNLELFEINFGRKYDVITAQSGEEGLAILRKNRRISITISDLRMPGMDGLEFVRRAKQEFPSNVFIILSGYSMTQDIADTLTQKIIYKYFIKPFEYSEVEYAVDSSCR